ncbi:MAG: peptidylprolyl isomerase, partial [Sphingobacteriales bacterium]|nr:peptidylprolyl isomerase [Sphingobacteriales bacterium]
MRSVLLLCCFIFFAGTICKAQKIADIKKELDTTRDPFGYVRFKLKKKYKVDTVSVVNTGSFISFMDSLAYRGKVGKVYGPFKTEGGRFLLKILMKAPNTFYHISHILIDTTTFRRKFADSLSNNIINKIKAGTATFEEMAVTYSSDNTSIAKGGDLGWFSRGIMLPQLEAA